MSEEGIEQVCPQCGKSLPPGESRCPDCDGGRLAAFFSSRETVLFLSAVILIALFFVTGFLTSSYHQKLNGLAQQWFAEGEQRLGSGDAPAALVDFRNALVYTPDDPQIQFRLAQALIAEGRDAEARAYLLGLLAHAPSDAPVNLALARISARSGLVVSALRYYHGAIYGVWPRDPQANRLGARLELCKFLLARNDVSQAEAELIAFASEIPEVDTPMRLAAGELFARSGDFNRAFEEFALALAKQPASFDAARGAGLAAYALGRFRGAEIYLSRAHRDNANDAEVSQALAISRLALSADPSLPGLRDSERRNRIRRDFDHAFSRFQSCARSLGENLSATTQKSDMGMLYARAKAVQRQFSRRSLVRTVQWNAVMDLVFEMEDSASQKCGPPQGIDQALVLLGKFRQGGER